MCGINGIFAHGDDAPPADKAELRRAREHMHARGPDGAGEWSSADGRVALGHRRLSIIDLREVAGQPMLDEAGELAVVFNGEIYGHRALRAALEAQGARFRTDSDTEVLLHLWRQRGPAMVEELRGMFAFALWDARAGTLFLARDPYGIKPLYVADDGRTLRFASQVKALLAGGGVDDSPEPAGHAGFFLWGSVPEPWTLHRGIRALPAGSTLLVGRDGRREERRFFDMAAILREAGPAPSSPGARAEMLRAALEDSVRHHLVADVPVGVFLSAGLDSTTIAALAAEAGTGDLRTVTLGFEEFRGGPMDETVLAAEVARQRSARHETRWIRGEEFAAARGALLDAMDQPSVDGVNTYFVARAAREAGLKVALSGLGGDELFASYPSFRQVPRLARAMAPLRGLAPLGAALRALAAPVAGAFTSPKYAGLLEYGTHVPGAYLLRRSLFMPWELDAVLPREVAREGLARLATIERLEADLDGVRDPRLQVSLLESSWYMRNQLLRDADWAGMAHSLEIRTPLVDATLLRAIAPLLAAGADAPGKRAMADAPRLKLPASILDRPKTGFVVPVRDWIAGGAAPAERGLRGWARHVHAAFGGREMPWRRIPDDVRRVLVFRLGSLGDTVVALPSFRLVARAFPQAERRVLTNVPRSARETDLDAVLGGTGLVHGYMHFDPSERSASAIAAVRREIRAFAPDVLVYLVEQGSRLRTVRHLAFFMSCGLMSIVGMPELGADGSHAFDPDTGLWEAEAAYLLRRISGLGEASIDDPALWDLGFTQEERQQADAALRGFAGAGDFLAMAPGSKIDAKDWGAENWALLAGALSARNPGLGLVTVGGPADRERAARVAASWRGPHRDLCGAVTPRVSALVLARARMLAAHDSGPMHLAAAVGTPVMAIFSARARPGIWFPRGEGNRILHRDVACGGCGLEACVVERKRCITSIGVGEAVAACRDILSARTHAA